MFIRVIVSTLISFLISGAVAAQSSTFTAVTGNWNSAANWSNGVPTSSMDAIIAVGSTCTVNIAGAQCASLTLNGGNGETRVNIGTGSSLSVTGTSIFNPPANGSRTNGVFITGTGSFVTGSLVMNNSVNNNRDCELNLAGGSATVNGNITMNGSATRNAVNFSGTATLNVSGSITGGTITAGTGTVNFNNAGAQTISSAYTYNHVTISGSGIKSIDGAETFNNLTISAGTLSVGANTLTLSGVLSGSGTIRGSSSSILVVNGTGTLRMDQSSSSTRTLSSITVNSAGTLTLNNPLEVSGTVTVSAGTLASAGNLTLIATASTEARIAQSAGSVTGNVTVQKYIPAGSARRWLHMGSPVSGFTWNQLLDDILISGPGAGGFDVNGSGFPSAYTYNESVAGDCGPNGWEFPTNVSNSVPSNKAIKFFFRGDRTPERLNWSNALPMVPVTIDFTGPVHAGTQNMGVTYTNNGNSTWDGWNFVPNPYPSAIDWNAASGWTKTNVSGTIYVWNAQSGTYATWNGASGTNGMTNGRIAMGQGFWVKATTTSPTLTMTEAVKVGTATAGFFKTNSEIPNTFRITMVQDSIVWDDAVFNFDNTFDRSYQKETGDALKLVNSSINIWSVSVDNENLVINNYPIPTASDTVVLGMTSSNGGIFTLNFSTDSLPDNVLVYLIDEFRGRVIDVRKEKSWRVLINADPQSYALGRLKLVFNRVGEVIWSAEAFAESSLQQARIRWNSTMEIYTSKYEVQHSLDSVQYTTIHQLMLNDTLLLTPSSYSFVHEHPGLGKNYYRVVKHSQQRGIEYSDVQTIVFNSHSTSVSSDATAAYSVYPVPAADVLFVRATLAGELEQVNRIAVFTTTGKEIHHIPTSKSKNEVALDITQLPAGVFIIQLNTVDGKTSHVKFYKTY